MLRLNELEKLDLCFITFGCGHPLRGKVLIFDGSREKARSFAAQYLHELRWCAVYDIADLGRQIWTYGLHVAGYIVPGSAGSEYDWDLSPHRILKAERA